MSQVATVDLVLRVGDTFAKVFRYGAGPIVYKDITSISNTAPVTVVATAHGLVDGWPVAITNVQGMTDINAEANAVTAADYRRATVLDPDTIAINAINAAGFSLYKSGGTLQYATPVDLTGITAELLIYPDGTGIPLSFTSAIGDIVIDTTALTLTIALSVADVAMVAAAMTTGTYDFNLTSGVTVTSIAGGTVTIDPGTAAPTT